MSETPGRNILAVGEPKGVLLNPGDAPVIVKDPANETYKRTVTKEFGSMHEIENARMQLEESGHAIVPGVDPIKFIGTRIQHPKFTEVVELKLV